MAREPYNAQKEHEIVGTYPAILGMAMPMPETPRFYRPIEHRENFKMLFEGKTPYWMPFSGYSNCDICGLEPRQNPDNLSAHDCHDGGPAIDYMAMDEIVDGWFGIPFFVRRGTIGAMPHGEPILKDACDWRELDWPDLDSWDWEAIREMNAEYLSSDKPNQLVLQYGFWERLMNLMGVSEAAMALIDEDQIDAVKEFFDALADLYIDYTRRWMKVGRIDGIMLHEDWGTSNGPFFSLETCFDVFVPPFKKYVDWCHEQGLWFEHHCCGQAQRLLPAMHEIGADFWFPQQRIVEIDPLIEECRDKHLALAVAAPFIGEDMTPEQIRESAKRFVDKYADKGVLYELDMNDMMEPGWGMMNFAMWQDAVYEFSRIAYQDIDDTTDAGLKPAL